MTDAEKYADRIAKLLAKAQSTTPEEAELLVEKAQELMTRHMIDQAMIDGARGVEREDITEVIWEYHGRYRLAMRRLAEYVAEANGCRLLMSDDTRARHTKLYVIGFTGDIERSRTLETSLQLQATSALGAWWAEFDSGWMTAAQKRMERRQFLLSFAHTIRDRLEVSKSRATEAARSDHGAGMDLVLRSRRDRVNDWVDQTYGQLRYTAGRSYKSGSGSARAAGASAGARADVGQPKVGGRGSLPKGG